MLYKYAIGIDIGGTTIKIGLVDLISYKIESVSIIDTMNDQISDAFYRIINAIEVLLESRKLKSEELVRIGIGILGPVIKGKYVLSVKGFHWDDNFNLKKEFEKYFSCNISIGNDVNVISYGEFAIRDKKHSSLVTIAIGTDVGVGLVLDGKIYEGRNSSAGEVAHIQLDANERECDECHLNGCISVLCGGMNVVKSFNNVSVLKIESMKELYQLASNNNLLAIHHLYEFHRNLSKVIRMLYMIIDPDLIVIAGGVCQAGDILIGSIHCELRDMKGDEFVRVPPVELSKLGNEAGILGAALL